MRRTFLTILLALSLLGAAPAYAQGKTASPSATPSASESSVPTASPSPTPTASASATPPASPSASASPSPSASLTTTPSMSPSGSPSSSPSVAPLSARDRAALALLDELDRIRPGVRAFSGPPQQRLQAAVDALRADLTALDHRLAAWRAQSERAAGALSTSRARVQSADRAFALAREEWRKNAGEFYMTGMWRDAIVVASGDLESASRARAYMAAVLDGDLGSLDRMRGQARRLALARDEATRRAASVARDGARIQREQARLDAMRRRMQSLLGDVVRSFGAGSSAFSRIIGAAQEGQVAAVEAARVVYRPIDGRVSSPFGMREHPIYHYRALHTGTDIAAAEGTPIRAPRDGMVLASTFAGPFGLATVIDHGGRIATVLAHQSSSLVARGDRVKAGDVVGFVGCTGWCTGPHLHFEVWFGAAAQDPAGWLVPMPAVPTRAPAAVKRPATPATAAAFSPPIASLREPLAGMLAPQAQLVPLPLAAPRS